MTDSNDTLAWISPAIETDTPTEQVLQQFDAWRSFVERVKEIDAIATKSVQAWIDANGGYLDSGNIFYWNGHSKDTKCVDVPGALAALMLHCGGDMEAITGALSANAIKHGAARKVLPPDVFDKLFKTETRDKLESGEVLPKKLQSLDKRFIKQAP
jgi:hypothetical protein